MEYYFSRAAQIRGVFICYSVSLQHRFTYYFDVIFYYVFWQYRQICLLASKIRMK